MVERLSYTTNTSLSLELTADLQNRPITQELVDRIQNETHAYFNGGQTTNLGVVVCPPGLGPEWPYYRPENENDWLPEVRAIARIGVQANYWKEMHLALLEGRINLTDIYSLNNLILFLQSNGNSLVTLNSDPNRIKHIATTAGDSAPRFPSYVVLINYGGDADFYGPIDNQIFPIRIKTEGKSDAFVQRESLGLDEEMVDTVWHSWRGISQEHQQIFHRLTQALLETDGLPKNCAELLKKALAKGEFFGHASSIIRALLSKDYDINITTEEVEKIIETLIPLISALVTPEDQRQIIDLLQQHCINLQTMYETAKNSRADIYHY